MWYDRGLLRVVASYDREQGWNQVTEQKNEKVESFGHRLLDIRYKL